MIVIVYGIPSLIVSSSEKYTFSLCLLTAYGLTKFKERIVAQLWVQNPGDTADANNRWSDLLRIAITPTAWGTDFHIYVISIVLNISIFTVTSFVTEHIYYIDPSLDLSQLGAYFHSHGERTTAHQLHYSEEHVQALLNEPYEGWIRDPLCSDSGYLPHVREICPQKYNVNSGIMKVLVFLLSVQPEMERKPTLLYTARIGRLS